MGHQGNKSICLVHMCLFEVFEVLEISHANEAGRHVALMAHMQHDRNSVSIVVGFLYSRLWRLRHPRKLACATICWSVCNLPSVGEKHIMLLKTTCGRTYLIVIF